MINAKTIFEQIPIEAAIRAAEVDASDPAGTREPATKRKFKQETPGALARAQGTDDHES